jgi:hypothetical protein
MVAFSRRRLMDPVHVSRVLDTKGLWAMFSLGKRVEACSRREPSGDTPPRDRSRNAA